MKVIAKPYPKIEIDKTESIILLKEDDSYPWAVLPVDFFWQHGDEKLPNAIYSRLRKGQTIIFELKEIA